MSKPLAMGTALERFTGVAPIFPLPSVALLPHVVQPLHVFEERYRILTADALQGPRLMAMAVLRPGWEACYERNDLPLHPVVCLSQIEVDHRLPDGRYLLLVRGLLRARIVSELSPELPYRRCRLELLPDVYAPQPRVDRPVRRRELLERFLELHPGVGETAELPLITDGELGLGALCDVLAFAADLATPTLLELLKEPRVDVRSEQLLAALSDRLAHTRAASSGFPPQFSLN
jgi:Lon protease-like protein